MRRLAPILVLLAAALALPATAAVTTTNNGDGTTSLRCTYVVPTAQLATIRADICAGVGWTAQVTCTSAMVAAGQCTSGQLGTPVANPESCPQAIDRAVRRLLLDARRAGEVQTADTVHVAPVRAADKSADIQP